MGLLCDGFYKYIGPTFCATCYSLWSTCGITMGLINLHTLYYRTICLKSFDPKMIKRRNLLFFWHYLVPLVYLAIKFIPSPDHLAVHNETRTLHPDLDYTPYLNFGGYSQAQKVFLDRSAIVTLIAMSYFPIIGSYWKYQAMKLLTPHMSPNTSETTRDMFRKLIRGLNFQIYLPLLTYVPMVFLFLAIQISGRQFLITLNGTGSCLFDPIVQIYFITPYREAVVRFLECRPVRFRSNVVSWASRVIF